MPKLWHLPEKETDGWTDAGGVWVAEGLGEQMFASAVFLASSLANLYARWTFSSRPKSCRKFCQVGAAHLRFLLRVNKTTTTATATAKAVANKLPALLFAKGAGEGSEGVRKMPANRLLSVVLGLLVLLTWQWLQERKEVMGGEMGKGEEGKRGSAVFESVKSAGN